MQPKFAEAHYNLHGVTLKDLGRLEEAKASYAKAIAFKPEYSSAKHLLPALSGETTTVAPRDYVEELFNNYALGFESSLVDNLDYKIPKVITELIIKRYKAESLGSIIDLGVWLRLASSPKFENFAIILRELIYQEKCSTKQRKKSIYNKLIKQDFVNYLLNENLDFDWFFSTDVFIYIGDLSDVFRLIKSRNKKGGKLAFSTEDYNGNGFFLEKSGRYSHSREYIENLCKTFGYKLLHYETQPLRKQKNEYISGGLYLLEF